MKQFETFSEISDYTIRDLTMGSPLCFNDQVRVVKWRVTIEKIDEPDSVIRERIQKLWDECENPHHWQPLKRVANKYGLELDFSTQHRNKR